VSPASLAAAQRDSENRSKIGACGGFYGAVVVVVTRNTVCQYRTTNRELGQSSLCSPATSCDVKVAANLRKHVEMRLLQGDAAGTLARLSLDLRTRNKSSSNHG